MARCVRALRWLLLGPLAVIEGWLALVACFQAALAAAAFFYRSPRRPAVTRRRRLALVVPAHNEAAVIGRLLASVAALDYPAEAHQVFVVADNCSDTTAAIARARGATVFERFDADNRGKGQALRWLLQRLPLTEFDAVVIVDADAVVSANLLAVIDDALAAGHDLVQVHDGVLNPAASQASGLRGLAFGLHNLIRPLGAEVLGLSAGLMGNGMAISTRLLPSWEETGLAEDLEMHAHLVAAGHRVFFAPEASAMAEMPESLAQSEGQNLRWEAGRFAVARRHAPRLLLGGLLHASGPRLGGALDLLTPPLSVQWLLAPAGLVAAVALGGRTARLLGLVAVAANGLYLALGLLRLQRAGMSPAALRSAPGYVLWKARLYAGVLAGRGPGSWVKGARSTGATNARESSHAVGAVQAPSSTSRVEEA